MAGSNTAAPNTAGTNKIHHQSGVLPSANDESLSVSQPGPRLFSTIGARCNSAGGVKVFKLVASSAIYYFIFNAKARRRMNLRVGQAPRLPASAKPTHCSPDQSRGRWAGETPALL